MRRLKFVSFQSRSFQERKPTDGFRLQTINPFDVRVRSCCIDDDYRPDLTKQETCARINIRFEPSNRSNLDWLRAHWQSWFERTMIMFELRKRCFSVFLIRLPRLTHFESNALDSGRCATCLHLNDRTDRPTVERKGRKRHRRRRGRRRRKATRYFPDTHFASFNRAEPRASRVVSTAFSMSIRHWLVRFWVWSSSRLLRPYPSDTRPDHFSFVFLCDFFERQTPNGRMIEFHFVRHEFNVSRRNRIIFQK